MRGSPYRSTSLISPLPRPRCLPARRMIHAPLASPIRRVALVFITACWRSWITLANDTLTIKVTDSLLNTASAVFTIPISAVTITTSSPLPNATQGSPYSDTLAATGGTPPYTWNLLSQSGSNSWSLSSSGVLTGTPPNLETDTLTIQATDSLSV